MYLHGKRYMSKYFNEGDPEVQDQIQKLFPELKDLSGSGDDSPIKELKVKVAYWRKANAIHAWFVKNCQEGNDDCGYYDVSREQLVELRDLCQRVLDFKHLATELLPTQSGFFFGSTDFDQYYYQDLENTIKMIDRALLLPDSWDMEYHSSW
jgi:hypothetical protein